jgi:hypothetical protein
MKNVRLLLLFTAPLLVGQRADYGPPRIIANVQIPGLNESSGLAASRNYPGVFWTHNDGEGGPYLYAFGRAGKPRARVRITGAKVYDWEDLAIGPDNHLYIGDIGDNDRRRKHIVVYRVQEPAPGATVSQAAQVIAMRYPDGPHDAEALLVHPKTGDIHIITKARGNDTQTRVYRAPAKAKPPVMLKFVADIEFPNQSALTLLVGRVTGGSISPDGKRVVLCDYFRAYEADVPQHNFDAVWNQRWRPLDIGKRAQGEAICYRQDGNAVLATSEGESFPLIEAERGIGER